MAKKKISDFGEKIGGAKKDRFKERGYMTLEDIDDMNERECLAFVTKDNVWPAPDFCKLVEEGMHPACALFVKYFRDAIAATLNNRSKVLTLDVAKTYVTFVTDMKNACLETIKTTDILSFGDRAFVKNDYLKGLGNYYSLTSKGQEVVGITNNLVRRGIPKDQGVVHLCSEAKLQNFPYNYSKDLKDSYVRQAKDKFEFLKKDGKYLYVKYTGESEEEVETYVRKTYLKEVVVERKKRNERYKIERPQLEHLERTGPQVRTHNISPEEFLNAFKFRGGEFGTWNTNKDRQACLNHAYESFCDLSSVLNLPMSCISLGGYKGLKLAIAFGSRGGGKALAHYEPMRVVINLTKMKGAGSLAHEYGHAFHDFLSHRIGLSSFLISSNVSLVDDDKYGHITSAYNDLIRNMRYDCNGNTCFYEGSLAADTKRSKPYYSTEVEMFARCFESYVQDKLGYKSDYLVYGTENDSHGRWHIYPEGAERSQINSFFEQFLKVVIDTFFLDEIKKEKEQALLKEKKKKPTKNHTLDISSYEQQFVVSFGDQLALG